ncbi:hypothetical protein AMTR_s00068p00108700 [Amborella trichopoda]|uniref:Uncharacterized protein n=1 Tax=Amborella trichopoda TaxID=13333 RepID=U5DIL8_AMBTC|nr:hypothetical protein AMTR_s00068p00108700 [Amborella trichopoda]
MYRGRRTILRAMRVRLTRTTWVQTWMKRTKSCCAVSFSLTLEKKLAGQLQDERPAEVPIDRASPLRLPLSFDIGGGGDGAVGGVVRSSAVQTSSNKIENLQFGDHTAVTQLVVIGSLNK